MTYLQFMIKCLNFFMKEKEHFDIYEFYFHWFRDTENDIVLDYESNVKKALMYLLLLETKKLNDANIPLLKLLEIDLSYFDVSLFKTLKKAEEKTMTSINEDLYMFDQVCLLEQDVLSNEEQTEIIRELSNEFKNHVPTEWEVQQYESAIHNVMEMVSQIIPELFFTEKGYKYIDNEYQIDDIQLRKKCYEYLKENINYYNYERIYKVDENIYSDLYEKSEESEDEFYVDEDELDEENLFMDGDEIRGQVDIYGADIDNYDILYYSATLLVVMLRLIKNKQYDKLERLIQIDETMTNDYEGLGYYKDKTLIESLYQPKTMGRDYYKEISTLPKNDFCLDFFLSNNEFTQQYNIQQLSLIIGHCFDFFDSDPINKMFKDINMINSVLATDNMDNQEEKIKKLVKIRNDNN